MAMDMYLMMLYVSIEQETALKQFFLDNGWPFCKPDLAQFTEEVGPLYPELHVVDKTPKKQTATVSQSPVVRQNRRSATLKQSEPKEEVETGQMDKGASQIDKGADQLDKGASQMDIGAGQVHHVDNVHTNHTHRHQNLDGTEVQDTQHNNIEEDNTVMDVSDTYCEGMEDERASEEEEEEEEIAEEVPETEVKKMLEQIQSPITRSRTSGRVRKLSTKLRDTVIDAASLGLGTDSNANNKDQKFSCRDCQIDFVDETKLRLHLKRVHMVEIKKEESDDSESLSSGWCTRYLSGRVKRTCQQNNTEDKGSMCGMCLEVFSENDLEHHYLTEHDMAMEYLNNQAGKSHQYFTCVLCDKPVGRIEPASAHMAKVHSAIVKYITPPPPKVKKEKKKKIYHMCLVCDESFNSMAAVKRHQKEMHNMRFKINKKVPRKRVHICETCGKLFSRSDNLKYHVDIAHLGKKPKPKSADPGVKSVCERCGASFVRKASLTEHMKTVHSSGPFLHKCSKCSASFPRQHKLLYHINKYHLNNRPFRCDKCMMAFYTNPSLKRHQIVCKIPLSDKFKCEECGHLLNSRGNLDMHKQAMHGVPALECPCGTVVRWKSSIAKHLRRCKLSKPEETEADERELVGDDDRLLAANDDRVLAAGGAGGLCEVEVETVEQQVMKGQEVTEQEHSNPWGNELMDKTGESQTVVEEVSEEQVEIIVKEATQGSAADPNITGVIDPDEVVAAVEQVVEDNTLDLGDSGDVVYEGDNTVTVQQTLYINVEDSLLDQTGNLSNSEALVHIAQQVLNSHDILCQTESNQATGNQPGPMSGPLANMDTHPCPDTEVVHGEVTVEEVTSSLSGEAPTMSVTLDGVQDPESHIATGSHDDEMDKPNTKLLYKCRECHKIYNNKYSLKRHIKSHQPGVRHCGPCNQYFDTEDDLIIHNDRYHLEMQICTLCGSNFSRKTTLRKHMLKRHPEQSGAQFRCPYPTCPSVYSFKKHLDDHMNIHNGKRPYQCKYCSKTYPLLMSLKNHESNHFKDNKVIKCNLCDLVFQSSGALSNHKTAVHQRQQYRCHCGKMFRYKPGLAKHQESHAREHAVHAGNVVHAEHTYSGTDVTTSNDVSVNIDTVTLTLK